MTSFIADSKVFLNPLKVTGTGVSTKSFFAVTHGVPLITNLAGMAGLCFGHPPKQCQKLFRIATTVQEFTDEISRLVGSEREWTVQSQKMLKHANATFSPRILNRESMFKGLLRFLAQRGCNEGNNRDFGNRPSWLETKHIWDA